MSVTSAARSAERRWGANAAPPVRPRASRASIWRLPLTASSAIRSSTTDAPRVALDTTIPPTGTSTPGWASTTCAATSSPSGARDPAPPAGGDEPRGGGADALRDAEQPGRRGGAAREGEGRDPVGARDPGPTAAGAPTADDDHGSHPAERAGKPRVVEQHPQQS